MTDVADLLKQHGAPLPNAVVMETEIRSEGALAFQTLNVPHWAADLRSSSVLAEWRCTLEHDDIDDLQNFLKDMSSASGVPVQQAINEAFGKLDIGAYLGTFIEEGLLVDGASTIRVLFAYQSKRLKQIEEFNRVIHDFLTNPGPLKEASDALNRLREFWRKGTNKWEGGLMMLSELNLYDPGRFPYTRARLSAKTGNP